MFKKKMFYSLFSIVLLTSSGLFGAASQPLGKGIKKLIPSKVLTITFRPPSGTDPVPLASILNLYSTSAGLVVKGSQESKESNILFIDLKTGDLLAQADNKNRGTDDAFVSFIPGKNIIADARQSNRGKFRIISDTLHEPKYKVVDGDFGDLKLLCTYNGGDDQRGALLAAGSNNDDSSAVTLFRYDDLKLHTKATTLPKQAKHNAKKISIEGCRINDVQFSDDGALLVVYADDYGIGSTNKTVSKLLLHKIREGVSKEMVLDLGVGRSIWPPKRYMYLTENNNTIFIYTNESHDHRKDTLYEFSCDTGICNKLLSFSSENNAFHTENAGMRKAVDTLNSLISERRMRINPIFVRPFAMVNKTGSLMTIHITDFIATNRASLVLLGKYYRKKKSGYRVIGVYDHGHMTLGDDPSVAFGDEEGKLYLTGFAKGNVAVFDGIVNNEIPQLQNLCAACIRENKKKIDPSVLPKLIRDLFALHVASSSGKRSGGAIEQQNPKKQCVPQS